MCVCVSSEQAEESRRRALAQDAAPQVLCVLQISLLFGLRYHSSYSRSLLAISSPVDSTGTSPATSLEFSAYSGAGSSQFASTPEHNFLDEYVH